MEEINWNIIGNNEIRRKFVISIGNDKKWWQFWKKDKSKEAVKNLKKVMNQKCDEDFFIPVNSNNHYNDKNKKRNMKNYVIAIVSFPKKEIKQFRIIAQNEYEGVKLTMIHFYKGVYDIFEIEEQQRKDYPEDIEGLKKYYNSINIYFSIIEV